MAGRSRRKASSQGSPLTLCLPIPPTPSPSSPPCQSSRLLDTALWQLLTAPDPLPGFPCHLDFGRGRGKGESKVPSSPAELGTRVLGICGPELRVLPNQEGQKGGVGAEEAGK